MSFREFSNISMILNYFQKNQKISLLLEMSGNIWQFKKHIRELFEMMKEFGKFPKQNKICSSVRKRNWNYQIFPNVLPRCQMGAHGGSEAPKWFPIYSRGANKGSQHPRRKNINKLKNEKSAKGPAFLYIAKCFERDQKENP